jgi:uncharacterized oligopeptide transporter (OPT) family protein
MMQSGGAEAKARVKWLFRAAAIASAFTFIAYFFPILEHPPLIENLGSVGAAAAAFGWKLFLDPMLTGAGALSGTKAGSSMMLGAVLAWAVIGPIVQSAGLTRGSVMGLDTGVRGWLLWPGVTLMLVDSIVTLCLSVPWASVIPCIKQKEPRFSHLQSTIGAGRQHDAASTSQLPASTEGVSDTMLPAAAEASAADIDASLEQVCSPFHFSRACVLLLHSRTTHSVIQVPTSWCVIGLSVSTVSCTIVLSTFFGLPPWQVICRTACFRQMVAT